MPQLLRIATFNVESLDAPGPGGRPSLADRVAILRPQLERLDADILCLQEVNGQRGGAGKGRELRALHALLAGTRYAGHELVSTTRPGGGGVLDLHNLVVLSALPVRWHRQYWHDRVPPLRYAPVTARPGPAAEMRVAWDRPILHVAVEAYGGILLHVFNVHLRAPLAAVIAGQKAGASTWKSVPGWAEGFYVAALKRGGQALEARLVIDELFDEDRRARVVVCGDFNASAREVPVRIVMGHEDDTGNRKLAARALVPLEQRVPARRRYSVLHDGHAATLDHVLVSAALVPAYRGAEIHNEDLRDEVRDAAAGVSYHAPVVASFDLAGD